MRQQATAQGRLVERGTNPGSGEGAAAAYECIDLPHNTHAPQNRHV